MRNTDALSSIVCCSAVRMSATRSCPCSDRMVSSQPVTMSVGFSGRSVNPWLLA
ncbi:Uncharacterised protein [Mycobacteroides abscessus subsp. abscessus]|nr:Uncharacterised protein [Mycobacteroides abscessus subsp. abscessus]